MIIIHSLFDQIISIGNISLSLNSLQFGICHNFPFLYRDQLLFRFAHIYCNNHDNLAYLAYTIFRLNDINGKLKFICISSIFLSQAVIIDYYIKSFLCHSNENMTRFPIHKCKKLPNTFLDIQ